MKILGIATMGGSSAAITIDGEVVAAIEEERLTRLKNDGGFPVKAIKTCLHVAGLELSQLDEIAVYWQPWRIFGRGKAVLFGLLTDPKSAKFRLKQSIETIFWKNEEGDNYPELRGSWMDLYRVKSILKREFGPFKTKVSYFDHHDCHAASIYHLSGFDRAICLSYDGGGEADSTVIYAVDKGFFERLKTIAWPNSLGHYYSAFTGFLGFRMLEGEYKMMGLAPYGKPRFKDAILNNILMKQPNGEYKLNTRILNYHAALRGEFTSDLKNLIGMPRDPGSEFTERHHDIAASVQAAYEENLLHMISWVKTQRPGYDNLCIAGGCGLNVTANGRIVENRVFAKILIPPAPHDAGCAVGAAFLSEVDSGSAREKLTMPHPYLGRAYDDAEIVAAFKERGLPVPIRYEEAKLVDIISTALTRCEIVAWFQGASEFGPRALGNRSFLADPRDDSIREVLNKKIKKRELFRPFAPSCKLEVANDYFEIDQESPYMNIVAYVRPEKRDVIPAVTHVDGTARVHTVDRKINPLYWKLIDAFEQKTGVGVLLNTSFNIQEPIVESPSQAIDCFLRSSVDYMALGNYVCDTKWRELTAACSLNAETVRPDASL
ncbi:hypothetical protein OAK90_00285 [bacterium]|nr:hypothetical protein [bacterium]